MKLFKSFEERQLKKYRKYEKQFYAKREKNKKKHLDKCKKLLSHTEFEDLMSYIIDTDYTFDYKFVKEKDIFGDKQEEKDYFFKHVFITQHVGIFGDDYSGTIFIPITSKKILCFSYEM